MSIIGDAFTQGTYREIIGIIDQLRAERAGDDYIVAYIRAYCEHRQKHDAMDPEAPKFVGLPEDDLVKPRVKKPKVLKDDLKPVPEEWVAFLAGAVAILEQEGGRAVKGVLSPERFSAYELDSWVGKMTVHVERAPRGVYTAFCRFEDVERARALDALDVNPHTGKYNFHASGDADVQEVVDAFGWHIRRAMGPRLCSMCQHGTTRFCKRCRRCRHLCRCPDGFDPANGPREG